MTNSSTLLADLRTALAEVRHRASMLEWAVIAAVILVASTLIGAAVYSVVHDPGSHGVETCDSALAGPCSDG